MDLKPATQYFKIPFICRNKIIDWPIFNFSEKDWCELFSNEELTFRKGPVTGVKGPIWDSCCEEEKMTLDDFFQISRNQNKHWLYYDYHEFRDLSSDKLAESVRWADLGFPEVPKKSSTLWIGNTGAHTPCHQDSYGFNLVAQISGRKLWLLMPPGESNKLKPTRVPYEESSIYSDIDFYNPTNEVLDLSLVYKAVLEPGDVLFVPRHWWHYVENLDVSVSVNTWIPCEEDNESRLEELLTREFVWQMCKDLTKTEAEKILSPRELTLQESDENSELLKAVIAQCQESRAKSKTEDNFPPRNIDVILLKPVEPKSLRHFVKDKARQFGYDPALKLQNSTPFDQISKIKLLINSFCHPEAIRVAKERLLEQIDKMDSNV